MNANHNGGNGRFCPRREGRTVNPREFGERDALAAALCDQADRVIAQHSDAFVSGGRCLVARHSSGLIEFIVLSGEGYEAYKGKDSECEMLPRRLGKVGGVQDGHNIRRGIRRWIGRNVDIIGDDDVFLRVDRGEDGVLRLSAVRVE